MVGKLNDIKPIISLIRSHYRIIAKHPPIKLMEVRLLHPGRGGA